MTEYQILGGTMTAPLNGVVFAYNPTFLQFDGITSTDKLYIDFVENSEYGTGETFSRMTLYLHDGSASVDISAYLRAEFAGKTKGTDTFRTSSNIAVTIKDEADTQDVTLEYCVVYGAILPGEIFNPSRTVKMWSAYPQVVPFYHGSLEDDGSTIYLQKDNSPAYIWQLPQNEIGTAMISLYDNQAETTPMVESGQIVIYPSANTTLTTFTMEYDGTFTSIEGETIINIEIDSRPQCDDHIFLRWLDKFGFWQYWLFKVGEVQVTDAVVGEALTFLTSTTYPYYATRNIGKSLVKQITACAPNLTREEWEMLSGMKGSVNVCAFDIASQSWVPVNIGAGNSVWKRGIQGQHLQDFAIKVVYPTIQTQRL